MEKISHGKKILWVYKKFKKYSKQMGMSLNQSVKIIPALFE